MADESKLDDTALKQKAADEAIAEAKQTSTNAQVESDNEEEDTPAGSTPAASAASKKKKSKKQRLRAALAGKSGEASGSSGSKDEISKAIKGLSNEQVSELLKMNPALAEQLGIAEGTSASQAADALKRLKLEDIMTGLASSGKNAKDMASYKFWATQPVPKFGEETEIEEGPFKIVDPEQVPKEPGPLVDGFEWVTMDLANDEEMKEVFDLLYGHYVEDDEAMFRFNYSKAFLKWWVS
jgi:glycylpeptide N-tetradecanoyltransferase